MKTHLIAVPEIASDFDAANYELNRGGALAADFDVGVLCSASCPCSNSRRRICAAMGAPVCPIITAVHCVAALNLARR